MRRCPWLLALLVSVGACNKREGGDVCLPREEGCACSQTAPTCEEGLVCDVGTCVPPGEVTDSGGSDTSTSDSAEEGTESGSGGGSLDCTGGECSPPDVGCGADQGCYPQPGGFICAAAGDAVPGDACEFVNDCVAGSACFNGGNGLTCVTLCTDDIDCTDESVCQELATAVGCVCG